MGKLLNLATLAAAAAGAAYYLEKKGILKVTNTVDENGAREFSVKLETPEKPLTETVKEDLRSAQDRRPGATWWSRNWSDGTRTT